MFLSPNPADTPALLADIESMIKKYDDDHRYAIAHIENTLKTALATVRSRQMTQETFSYINNQADNIKYKLADVCHELRTVGSYVDLVNNMIAQLEPNW
jgi:DNA repair ATPase RecN